MIATTPSAADIEAIERATMAAVAPEALEEIDDWLIGFDSGVVGRAKSAVPLQHAAYDPTIVAAIEGRYRAHGLPPRFRIAECEPLESIRVTLDDNGYEPGPPTLVQIGTTTAARAAAQCDVHIVTNADDPCVDDAGRAPSEVPNAVHIARKPDDAWIAAFLGEGFDPVDGASRAKTLARGADTLFASVREGEVAIGAGAMSFGFGWASIHGMRTAKSRRGERIGARIIAALAHCATERAMDRIFLQVDAHNAPAIALYRRAGFATAWRYAYWTRPLAQR